MFAHFERSFGSRKTALVEYSVCLISGLVHLWRCSAGNCAPADCELLSSTGTVVSVPAYIYLTLTFGLAPLVYLSFSLRFNEVFDIDLFPTAGHWCTMLDQPATSDSVLGLMLQLLEIVLSTHAF